MIVVDASALTALLLRETGHESVSSVIAEASISSVNLAEVLSRMNRDRVRSRPLMKKLAATGLTVVKFDEAQAVIVSDIREPARSSGVGLADCCCLALALHKAWPVLTADRIWTKLGFAVDVRLIR